MNQGNQVGNQVEFLISILLQRDGSLVVKHLGSLDQSMRSKVEMNLLQQLLELRGLFCVTKNQDLFVYDQNQTDILYVVRLLTPLGKANKDQVLSTILDLNLLYPEQQIGVVCLQGFEDDVYEFEQLGVYLFDYHDYVRMASIVNGKKYVNLLPHNQHAYRNIRKHWAETLKVAVVQATGTGKSYIISQCVADFATQRCLILAPSHYILHQIETIQPWASDFTHYMTYMKAMSLTDEEIDELDPALIVLDEFHRVGAEKWGDGVKRILARYPTAYLLGTSATPIRYLDNARDMSEELFEGRVASNLSLVDAVAKGILPEPIYVSGLYTLDIEMANLEARIKEGKNTDEEKSELLKQLQVVKQNWENSQGVPEILKKHLPDNATKFIVFVESVNHLKSIKKDVVAWFQQAISNVQIETYTVLHSQGEWKNERELRAFEKANDPRVISLLFSVDMLNEGIHVDGVSGVVLLRHTVSPIIFYQQIGRALQAGNKEQSVIFDLVNNFRTVSQQFQLDLEEAERRNRKQHHELGLKQQREINFSIIDETHDVMKVFSEIQDRIHDDWDKKYQELATFYQAHGHVLVTEVEEAYASLGLWCNSQRAQFHNGTLDQERIDKLNELQFVWNSRDNHWQSRFEELIAYNEKFGNTQVPHNDSTYESLWLWCKRQRDDYKRNRLSIDRIEKLRSVGFEWNPVRKAISTSKDQRYLDELKTFFAKHGHSNVPRHADYEELARWCSSKRVQYKSGKLADDMIRELSVLQFDWDPNETQWEKMFEALYGFYQRHQHTLVPNELEWESLRNWCVKQRVRNNKGLLSQSRIEKLNSLGFVWDVHELKWRDSFQELVSFYRKHGHSSIPMNDKNNSKLRAWCNTQRAEHRKGNLSQERINELKTIEFEWE